MCRERCEYFSVCGGGEPVNKLAENGTFASTETAYCRLTKMRATDLVLDALERAQPSEADCNRAGGPCVERPTPATYRSAGLCG
jgi:sulfatase maturation enzyme AslB (radical SAM superfamily)